jgi:gamma-glutamyltranspeptidase/glutathione hydrolase
MTGDRPTGNPRGTRSPVLARNGLIATSQPLASAAGLQVLQAGGNAIDAAVTAAAVLGVVEPTMTGVGGDVFAIVHDGRTRTLTGLNSSGRAGTGADADLLRSKGIADMPADGVYPITVPGAVAGWSELLARHGTIPLARALEPAIGYARDGFAVSEIIAAQWQAAAPRLQDPAAAAVFLPAGRAPRHGDLFRNPDLAKTLELIARDGASAVYGGAIGAAIAGDVARRGGFLRPDDFARHHADWVRPISTTYRGYELFELPPNTQGFVALEMLNVLEGYDIRAMGHNSADYLHRLAEAKRIAFADRGAHLADPAHVPAAVLERLISKAYAAERRRQIDDRRAGAGFAAASFGGRDRGDTVYLAAADRHGNVVSFINSLFSDFGSGIVASGTGVMLHNRGLGFSLEKGHPNQLAPGKRPLHTLVPAFLMKDGRPVMAFGVMGGDNQAQAHVQIVVNVVDFGMNVQEAGEVARVRHLEEGLALESAIRPEVRADLASRGHVLIDGRGAVGGYQAVMIDQTNGVLMGGSDPRKDGQASGY